MRSSPRFALRFLFSPILRLFPSAWSSLTDAIRCRNEAPHRQVCRRSSLLDFLCRVRATLCNESTGDRASTVRVPKLVRDLRCCAGISLVLTALFCSHVVLAQGLDLASSSYSTDLGSRIRSI